MAELYIFFAKYKTNNKNVIKKKQTSDLFAIILYSISRENLTTG